MEFRKVTSVPAASGLPDAIYFVKTATGLFDIYISDASGNRTTLDRTGVKMTSGGTPHADPRYGDIWEDTTTDHFFQWANNGVGNYWIDIS